MERLILSRLGLGKGLLRNQLSLSLAVPHSQP